MSFLDADAAREILFNRILDQLAASSLFSNSSRAPEIFIVYAHDNEKEGDAYDEYVRQIIVWLRKIHARILSDQSPLPPLTHRIEGDDAIRNILDNQLCLLPPRTDDSGNLIRTSVDKIVVCGSEVLERYYNKPSALSYIQDIVDICIAGADESASTLQSNICSRVEIECGKDDFHHLFTELAFLEVRKSESASSKTHGIVPIVLNQSNTEEAPMRYLKTFRNTDIKLKLKSLATGSRHKLFFKLLEQLFPDDRDFIRPFRECYDSASCTLQLEDEPSVARERFNEIVNSLISRAYQEYWSLFCVLVRDGKLQAYSSKISDQVSSTLEMIDQKVQNDILDWLSPMSAPELHGKYHDSETARIQGTCDWTIQDKEFSQWYVCRGSALLLLSGNMGTGKTYSISRVVDWVKDGLSTNSHDEGFAYFYCYRQDPARSGPKEILRNIIRQLAIGPWKAVGRQGAIHKSVHDLWKNSRGQGISSTFPQWEECLLALINTYPRTTIVLDALDECSEEHRQTFIKLLIKLGTRQSDNPVKIFVSTRPEEEILRNFDKFPTIRMQEKNNADDIATFVRIKIAEHRRWSKMSDEFRTELVDTLLEKAEDMFLFASLQIEHLLNCRTQPALKSRLLKIPDSLEKTYKEIYQKAASDADERQLLDRALRWVMCSVRPLTTNELAFAISQDPESERVVPQRQDIDEELILDLCHNLLCLDISFDSNNEKDPPVWRLAHQAVAEFLDKNDHLNQESAHYQAGKMCLILLLDTFGGRPVESKNGLHNGPNSSQEFQCPCRERLPLRESESPGPGHYELQKSLAEYAAHAWPTHVRIHEHCEPHSNGGLSKTLSRFLHDPKKDSMIYERWLEHVVGSHFYSGSFPGSYPPQWSVVDQRQLYRLDNKMSRISLACYLGFPQTLAEWLDPSDLEEQNILYHAIDWSPWPDANEWSFRSKSDHYLPETAYSSMRACTRTKNDIIYFPDWLSGEPLKWSLVALACAHDEAKALRCLLDRGANFDNDDEDEMPPIVAAAIGNSEKAAHDLIERGIDMCSPFTRQHGPVLLFAIYCDSLKVLPLLLDHILCDSSTVIGFLASVRMWDFESADAITILVEKGVDVNTPLQDGTLLAVAAYWGSEDLVTRLLGKGAYVNTKFQGPEVEGWNIENALEASMWNGYKGTTSIQRLLIKHGADISAKAVAIAYSQIERLDENLDENLFGWEYSQDKLERGYPQRMLRLFVLNMSNPDETCTDIVGDTTCDLIACALTKVLKLGSVDEVKMPPKLGADANLWALGCLNLPVAAASRRDYPLTFHMQKFLNTTPESEHFTLVVGPLTGRESRMKDYITQFEAVYSAPNQPY